jgi:hypothetical protein
MAITQDDLNDFQIFAANRVASGEAESMADLVSAWEDQRQYRRSVEALQESDADAKSGRLIPAKDVFADVRKSLRHPE